MADTLTGVVVGGAISTPSTIFVNFGLHYWKQRSDSIALAKSFRGAINSLVTIIEIRRYPEFISGLIAAMQEDQQPRILKLKASRNYVEIYSKNVDKLGMLRGRLPESIPQFYTMANALLEDVDAFASGSYDEIDVPELTDAYEKMIALLAALLAIANNVIEEIDDCYGRSDARVPRMGN
jgi:hypothetical protein